MNDGLNSLARMYSGAVSDFFAQAVISFMVRVFGQCQGPPYRMIGDTITAGWRAIDRSIPRDDRDVAELG